jgi:hypothetical protein
MGGMMGRKCSICEHEYRANIEQDILNSVPYRAIAEKYRVNRESLRRHHDAGHIAQELVKSAEAREIAEADSIMKDLMSWKGIIDETLEQLEGASRLQAVDRGMKWTELKAKIMGMINEGVQINIIQSPQYNVLVQILWEELESYPEVRERISRRLRDVEEHSDGS